MYRLEITSRIKTDDVHQLIGMTLDEAFPQYYFKGTHSTINFKHGTHEIVINSSDEAHVNRLEKLLRKNIDRLNLNEKLFITESSIPASGGRFNCYIAVKNGLSREECKQVVKIVKNVNNRYRPEMRNSSVFVMCSTKDEANSLHSHILNASLDFPVTGNIIKPK